MAEIALRGVGASPGIALGATLVHRAEVTEESGHYARLKLHRPAILVARDLDPSETIGLDRSLLLGIVTEQGGATAHTSTLARTWGIPAVTGVAGLLERVQEGQTLVMDGASGDLVIDPGPVIRAQFRDRLLEGSPGVDRS